MSAPSNRAEQVTISLANQQNQNPEQITIHLRLTANEQIVLNPVQWHCRQPTQGIGVDVSVESILQKTGAAGGPPSS